MEQENQGQLTTPPFRVDDKVYCLDAQQQQQSSFNDNIAYYEAVVRKTKLEPNNTWLFFVHYTGWNSRWDRWVEATSIRKEFPSVPHFNSNHAIPDAAPGGGSGTKTNTAKRSRTEPVEPKGSTSARKRLATSSMNSTMPMPARSLVYGDYCELPFSLKTVLVDEFDRIAAPPACHKQPQKPRRLLHRFPATVTVRKLVHHFRKKKLKEIRKSLGDETTVSSLSNSNTPMPELVEIFCRDLLALFQEALPKILLYPQERPQLEHLKVDNAFASVYGCEFLLRLYLRLPVLLHHHSTALSWSPAAMGPLLADLLVLMQKNRNVLFPLSVSSGKNAENTNNANYRAPLDTEWMEWERADAMKLTS